MIDAACCCGRDVLLWGLNSENAPMVQLKAFYEAMGLKVDTHLTWSTTLQDYKLIVWPTAVSDPVWWPEITNNRWTGRLALTAEHSKFPNSVDYMNGLAALTGMSVIADLIDADCSHDGTAEPDALTVGQAVIKYALTSQITGGTTLSFTETGAKSWLAHNQVNGIDFVVAGDSNWIVDDCGIINDNKFLIQNLWKVAV